ncbi:vitamin-K epoxide reductase [Arctopsyche grandis]|uniref:vitamin-K epoxide reductase n=1 Tax=Arctopsyche grandis TaxID=121162 RepID=UPI00406D876B
MGLDLMSFWKSNETTKLLQTYNKYIIVTCAVGVILSAYAYYVEVLAEGNYDYSALCDISEHISCTKVFSSEYGKGFGFVSENSPLNLPNGLMGMAFYGIIALFSLSNDLRLSKVQMGFSFVSVLLSIRLAYILYFILYDFCVVCVSTYVVNIANTTWTFLKVREAQKMSISIIEKDD